MGGIGHGPVFELAQVGRRYGGFEALRDVSLTIRAGERVGLIGPSGAGKSTLLSLLNTAGFPTSGSLRALGEDPTRLGAQKLRRLRARVGTVHQMLDLVPQSSVFQNVVAGRLGRLSTLGALRALVSRREAAQVEALLARLGIVDKLYERTDRLSGGEQQRVAIARVLHQAPDVLLADEPLASVDPARSVEIVGLLVRAAEGRTLVVSTHQLEPIRDQLTRVIGLRAGRVHFDRAVSELTAQDLASLYALGGQAPSEGQPLRGERARERLRLGATPLAVHTLLPEILRRAAVTGVRVQVVSAASAALLDDVRAGRLDAAVVDARMAVPDVVYEELSRSEVLLVAAPHVTERLQGVLTLPWAARLPRVTSGGASAAEGAAAAWFAGQGAPLSPDAVAVEAEDPSVVRAALCAGAGVGFVCASEVQDELSRGALVTLPLGRRGPDVGLHVAARRESGVLSQVLDWARSGGRSS